MNEGKLYEEVGVLFSDEQIKFVRPLLYHWLHIPSGKKEKREIWVLGGEKNLLILLNHWNKQKDWKYWY